MLATALKGGQGQASLKFGVEFGLCEFYFFSRCTARIQIAPRPILAISQGPFMGVIIFRLRELTV